MFFLKNKGKINFNHNSINFIFISLIGLCIIYFYFVFDNIKDRENFISSKHNFNKYTDEDILDDFYVDFYDKVYVEKERINFEETTILPLINNKKSKILDIGCGTGQLVNRLDDNNKILVTGADISEKMLSKAKQNYPDNNFVKKNCSDSLNFYQEEFNIITILYFTIYYFPNKEQLIENCFRWIKPGGYLILHLVNLNKFDPYGVGSNEKSEKKSISYQDEEFNYSSKFIIDKSKDCKTNDNTPNITYKEFFKFNNNKSVRMNEHNLYGTSQKLILSMALEKGFILREQKHMKDVGATYQYLYVLQKPE